MNSNLSSSTAPCVNPLGIATEAVMSIGTNSLAAVWTSAGPFSQLIDPTGTRVREEKRERRRCAGVPSQSQKTSNRKPRPNPPELKLNDSQPLADNKTSIKFAYGTGGGIVHHTQERPDRGKKGNWVHMGGGKWKNFETISVEYLMGTGQKRKLKIIRSRWTVLWVFLGNLLVLWKKCVCLFCAATKWMACWVVLVLVYDCLAITHNLECICYRFMIYCDLLVLVSFHSQPHHFYFSGRPRVYEKYKQSWVICGYCFICTLLHNSLGSIQIVPHCNSFVPVTSWLPTTIK